MMEEAVEDGGGQDIVAREDLRQSRTCLLEVGSTEPRLYRVESRRKRIRKTDNGVSTFNPTA